MNFTRSMTSVAAVALFAASSTVALAASDQEITAALTALVKAGNAETTLELGTPQNTDGVLVYSNVKIKTTGIDSAETTIATLTITGGDLNDKGGLVAESIAATGLEAKSASNIAKVATIEVTGVDAGAAPAPGTEPKGKFDTLSIDGIDIAEQGQPPVKIASVAVEAADYAGDYPRSIGLAIDGIEIDPAMAGEGDPTAAQLKELGYSKVTLGVTASGTWDEATGTVELEDLTIDGAEMGAMSLAGTLGGFTPEVVAQMNQPTPPPDLMDKITLSTLVLSYSDASLAGRLLDMQAKQMGADRATFVEQITAALPLMLTALQNPAFQEQVAGAATTFLKDPQSITLTIEPAAPVTLTAIAAAAQTAPQTLPDTLKATVTANETE